MARRSPAAWTSSSSSPSKLLTQHEIDAANLIHFKELNVQNQQRLTWPQNFTVARAYLDQLERSEALPADRLATLRASLDSTEKVPLQRQGSRQTQPHVLPPQRRRPLPPKAPPTPSASRPSPPSSTSPAAASNNLSQPGPTSRPEMWGFRTVRPNPERSVGPLYFPSSPLLAQKARHPERSEGPLYLAFFPPP